MVREGGVGRCAIVVRACAILLPMGDAAGAGFGLAERVTAAALVVVGDAARRATFVSVAREGGAVRVGICDRAGPGGRGGRAMNSSYPWVIVPELI